MAEAQQSTGKKSTTIRRNGLTVECFLGSNGKLERKIERYGQDFTEYTYQYDAKGHLTKVRRGGTLTEEYEYNQRGQRVDQQREYRGFSDSTGGWLRYDEDGRLLRAGGTSFYYDKQGALSERCDSQGSTKYFYGKDTMLDKVVLPSRAEIRYEYDKSNPIAPARRFKNGNLTAEFAWTDPIRLARYRDHDNLLEYSFSYDDSGVLSKVRIDVFKSAATREPSTDWLGEIVARDRLKRLHDFLGKRSLPLELLCGCDQVGTLRLLTDKSGRIVKEVLRDSFGVQLNDSFPDLFMPIGFAGGLTDPDTGLVRFGYRDYDPSVGRFTALDPAKDRRGDGDLYDYCVDDPVNAVDPTGLMGCRPQFRADEEQQQQAVAVQAAAQRTAQTAAQAAAPEVQQPAQAQDNRPDERQWTYNQRTGQLRDPDGVLHGERGYSGWHEGGYRNNPATEDVRERGPIPAGRWRIHDRAPEDRPNTGLYSIEIQPDGHNARGRTDFYIHGDSKKHPGKASKGCPILRRHQREAIYNSGVRSFRVVDEPEW